MCLVQPGPRAFQQGEGDGPDEEGVSTLAQVTDEQLVAAVRAGDMQSLGQLVVRWERPLFRFVSRMVPRPDDARDVCQETFLRVMNRADRFRTGSRFSTWMYQIALNLCRDRARRKRRWGKILDESVEAPVETTAATGRLEGLDPEADSARRELTDAVRGSWSGLERTTLEERTGLCLEILAGSLEPLSELAAAAAVV